jgi:glycine cleavage system protein P-like pyridoxal-binding family
MSKALIKRINKAFGKIYDMGDSGLDYMDGHSVLNANLMQHFYDNTLDTLSKEMLEALAVQLETVVADAEFDIEA